MIMIQTTVITTDTDSTNNDSNIDNVQMNKYFHKYSSLSFGACPNIVHEC